MADEFNKLQNVNQTIPIAYPWVANVDVSVSDYTAPAGYAILEIRTGVAGNVKMDTPENTGVVIPYGDMDRDQLKITKIYSSGTTATGITVRGFKV